MMTAVECADFVWLGEVVEKINCQTPLRILSAIFVALLTVCFELAGR